MHDHLHEHEHEHEHPHGEHHHPRAHAHAHAHPAPAPGSAPRGSFRARVILLGLGAVAVIALVRSLVIVDQTEAVYITEFGRPVRLIEEPGLHMKWPYQSQRAFDRRIQLDAPAPREMLTRDKKNLEVAWYVGWKIQDVDRFLKSVRTIPDASARLEDMAASVLAAELGGRDLPALVKVGDESALGELMNQVTSRIGAQAGQEYGITVVDVRLRRLNYPEEVRSAVFEQIRSERRRVAAATRAEGESQARTIRSAADRERARTIAQAEADAARLIGEGEAQATRIANEAHAADPSFYQFLKTLETYRSALDKRTTLILSAESAFLKLLTQGVPDLPAPPRSMPSAADGTPVAGSALNGKSTSAPTRSPAAPAPAPGPAPETSGGP